MLNSNFLINESSSIQNYTLDLVAPETDDCEIQTRRRTSPRLSLLSKPNTATVIKQQPVVHGLNEAFFNATNNSLGSIPSSGSQPYANSPSKRKKTHADSSNSSIISIDDDEQDFSSQNQPRGSTQILAAGPIGSRKLKSNSQSLQPNTQSNVITKSQQLPIFLDCSSILADNNKDSSTTDTSTDLLNNNSLKVEDPHKKELPSPNMRLQSHQPSLITNTIEIDDAENEPTEENQQIGHANHNSAEPKPSGDLQQAQKDHMNDCDSSSELLMALMVVCDTQPVVTQKEAQIQSPSRLAVVSSPPISTQTNCVK
jgi:hypothetical protein